MIGEERRNIVLCGFMATGKSSVGKRLAALLGYEFLDMDAAIEADAGLTIPQVFSSQGEPAFRALESQMVERVAGKTGCVVATGGGTIANPQNLERLKLCGVIITLTADIETILLRVGSGDDRPMLREGDRFERIRTLMEKRAPFYAQADIVLDTSSLSVEEAAHCIADRLRESGFFSRH
jgi:shikimate kinase